MKIRLLSLFLLWYVIPSADVTYAQISKDSVLSKGSHNAIDSLYNARCDRTVAQIIRFAKTYIGTPYTWGGNGEDSFDCSGFVKFVYGHFGIEIPRHSKWQCNSGEFVPITKIKKGDLVFFISGSYPNRDITHVGIVISDYQDENFRFIHACKGAGEVCINQYKDDYYYHAYGGARRFPLCD